MSRLREGYSPPAGDMAGVKTFVSPKSQKNLPGDIDREKQVVLPPGSATPNSPKHNDESPKDHGRDLSKFEMNTPGPGSNVKDKARTVPEPGEERGHPTNVSPSYVRRRTMTGYRVRSPFERQERQDPDLRREDHRYYVRKKNRILRRQEKWYKKVRNNPSFLRLRQKQRKSPNKYKRKRAGEEIEIFFGVSQLHGYVLDVEPPMVTFTTEEGVSSLPVRVFLNSMILSSEEDEERLTLLLDSMMGEDWGDLTPAAIHARADLAGVPWDNDEQFMVISEALTGKRHLDDMTLEELDLVDEAIVNGDFGGTFSDGLTATLIQKWGRVGPPSRRYKPRSYSAPRMRKNKGLARTKARQYYRKNRHRVKRQSKLWYRKRKGDSRFKRRQHLRRRNPGRFKKREGSVLTAPEIAFVTGADLDLGYVHNLSPMTGMVTFNIKAKDADPLYSLPVMAFLSSVVFLSDEDIDAMFDLIDVEIGEEAYEDMSVEDMRQCAELFGADPESEAFLSQCEDLVGTSAIHEMSPDELELVTGTLISEVLEGSGVGRTYDDDEDGEDIGDPVEIDPADDSLFYGEVDLREDLRRSVRPVAARFLARKGGDIILYDQENPKKEIDVPSDTSWQPTSPSHYENNGKEHKTPAPGIVPRDHNQDANPASSRVTPNGEGIFVKQDLDLNDKGRKAGLAARWRARTAARMDDIAKKTTRAVHERASNVRVRLSRADPQRGIWQFQVMDSESMDPSVTKARPKYIIRVKGKKQGTVNNLSKAQLHVSCSCPFFRWQGPEHWAKTNRYLYGKPKGTASRPMVRDPASDHWACKHVLAAFKLAKNYRFATSDPVEKMHSLWELKRVLAEADRGDIAFQIVESG